MNTIKIRFTSFFLLMAMGVFIAVPSFSVQAQGYPKQKLAASGADAVGSTPEAFKAFIEAETLKWGKVIKDAKIVNQ